MEFQAALLGNIAVLPVTALWALCRSQPALPRPGVPAHWWEWHVPVLAYEDNRNSSLWVLCPQSPFANPPPSAEQLSPRLDARVGSDVVVKIAKSPLGEKSRSLGPILPKPLLLRSSPYSTSVLLKLRVKIKVRDRQEVRRWLLRAGGGGMSLCPP